MPENSQNPWPGAEILFVEEELAKEYPSLSFEVINMVVAMAKTVVTPVEGRVALLKAARKKLARPVQ
jgi:hypothetical protein